MMKSNNDNNVKTESGKPFQMLLIVLGIIFCMTGLFIIFPMVSTSYIVNFPTDISTGAFEVIDYEHHEIHAGNHFFYEDYTTLDISENITFCIQTSNTTKWTHLVWEILSQGKITFEIYENSTITYNGVDLTSYNNNRNSDTVSNWVEFQSNPTVTNLGLKLGQTSVGDATNPNQGIPAGGDRNRELMLRQNEDYCFVIESMVNDNTITYLAEWYEHTNQI